MPPRYKKKTETPVPDVRTADAPVPEESVKAGNVYQTVERLVAVIVEVVGDFALVAYAPSAAHAEITAWVKLKKSARRVSLSTCAYHADCENWTLIKNIESGWKK